MFATIRPLGASAPATLAVLLAALPALAPAAAQSQERDDPGPTLEVAGSAEISVPSDRARIALAVETQAESAGEASRENAAVAEAVVDAVQALEIEGLHVETRGYRLQPQYRRPGRGDPDPPEVVAYRVTNQVMVTIDDVEAAGTVVDAGVEAGANRVGSLRFDLQDREPAREEALREAVRKARREAEVIAEAMDVGLGQVQRVRTDPGRTRVQARTLEVEAMAMAADARPTPVEPGDVEVSAEVQVTFALDP